MARKPPGLFITGTDTGIGKTYVAALVARALRKQRYKVGVYKPVATGCVSAFAREGEPPGEPARRVPRAPMVRRGKKAPLISCDAKRLWEAAGRPGKLAHVCPQMFLAPLAPHLAAAAEQKTIDAKLLRTGVEYWQQCSDIVLVEGAGGLMSPLTEDGYNADLALELGYPLIVVVPNRIGAINQALQTLIAAATFKEGLTMAGIVLNESLANWENDPSTVKNADELARRCVPPVLCEVRFDQRELDANLNWFDIAQAARLS
jgi:dethiobiotin synthetase